MNELLPGGTDVHLQQLAARAVAAATAGPAAGPGDNPAGLTALMDSLLSADAGPPQPLASLDAAAPAVKRATAYAAQLAIQNVRRVLASGAAALHSSLAGGGGAMVPPLAMLPLGAPAADPPGDSLAAELAELVGGPVPAGAAPSAGASPSAGLPPMPQASW